MRYRVERKYITDNHTAEILRRRVSAVLHPDTHSGGRYRVDNLYFDDIYNSSYQEKQLGCFSREKFRIRYYNGDLSFIRFERKHKDGELSYKLSAPVTAEQLDWLKNGDFSFAMSSNDPYWQKIGLLHRTRGLRPVLAFSYMREAYVCTAGDVRITFDSQIAEDVPRPPSDRNGVIEVKYTGFLPDYISGLLGGVSLAHTEMSKYCLVRKHSVVTPKIPGPGLLNRSTTSCS